MPPACFPVDRMTTLRKPLKHAEGMSLQTVDVIMQLIPGSDIIIYIFQSLMKVALPLPNLIVLALSVTFVRTSSELLLLKY